MLGFSFFCYIKMSFLQESEVQSSDDIAILWLLMRLADTKVSPPSIHMVILTQYALVHKCKPTSGEMEETRIYVSQPTEHQVWTEWDIQMLSVLKVTPGSIWLTFPLPRSRLAADVATKWSMLEMPINPPAWHTQFCFWAHTLWLLMQLHIATPGF